MIDTIERPEGTYSPDYIKQKEKILEWRENNKEWVRNYNREYQRKLRKDPVRYQEMRMRIELRAYLVGKWKRSYKIVSALGLDRTQFAQKYNTDEAGLKELLKKCEIDHILPATWFHKKENLHLKPFQYRHENIQLVEKLSNRSKHSWIDESDPRVQFVKTKLEMYYASANNSYSAKDVQALQDLSDRACKLERLLKKPKKKK